MRSLFKKVLVANRGEIAVRVMRASHELGIGAVAVYSDVDRDALHVRYADEAVRAGPPQPAQSYLYVEAIIGAAQESGAEAIHPGYGFLSERPESPEAYEAADIAFIGPPAQAMCVIGATLDARGLARKYGVPVAPGSGSLEDPEAAVPFAREAGFPVIIKPSGGRRDRDEGGPLGGGAGGAVAACANAARNAFGDATVYLEKYVRNPRHIEIQVIADRHGNVVHLGTRECSIQRRHQKILEETPSPAVTPQIRERMGQAAIEVFRAAGYVNAGTAELIFSEGDLYFLEMNAWLQVEPPVTEMVTGVDLVREQIQVAAGLELSFRQEEVTCINAENPVKNFIPNPKHITRWLAPSGPGARVDSNFGPASDVPPYYDSLIAKLIVHGGDREEAIARLRRALSEFVLVPPSPTNGRFSTPPTSRRIGLTTHFIAEHPELLGHARAYAEMPPRLDYESEVATQVATS